MPRQARLDYEGCFYHIINRGSERKLIFREPEDYIFFIKALGKIIEEENYKCYGWVLMPNHFHLVVERNKYPVSRLMSRISTRYALYFNRKYKRYGRLFQNRYKAILCDSNEYFLELVAYVHLNPLRAKMVKSLESLGAYPWSGHRAITGQDKTNWQDVASVLKQFDQKEKKARQGYVEYLKERSQDKKDLSGGGLIRSAGGIEMLKERGEEDGEMYDTRVLGDGEFVEKILKEEGEEELVKRLKYDEIKERVLKEIPVDERELTKPGKSTKEGKKTRAVLSYIAVKYGKEKRIGMADRFQITPAAIGPLMRYGEEIVEQNQRLKKSILK